MMTAAAINACSGLSFSRISLISSISLLLKIPYPFRQRYRIECYIKILSEFSHRGNIPTAIDSL